ncbi:MULTISPECIES: hypothetical protein [Anaerococcus]|uniref:Uncharacterized protein n=1 Tax=Anaerococcus octavius TaxID=54007 RepID=A0A2I1MAU5_9FIRM|nr:MULTISPECIES: hypothetical protein [Anaerococcus]MBS6105508.1 hypothetical protein [Anaerococcus sp.]PKZ17255.1 hypothetical protein CYJ34_00680 [Anaerococcus octavius]
MKVKKIKSYTCLALALTLVLPVTAHASDEVEKEMLSLTSDEKTSDNGQKDSLLSPSLDMDFDKEDSAIKYTINIAKTNKKDKLQAIFYLRENSNLENLDLESDENISQDKVKVANESGLKKITIDLEDQTSIKLKAHIKEGMTDNFAFDYIIANDSQTAFASKRVNSFIAKDENGKDILKANDANKLNSMLYGKFLDEKTIEWSDFLLNDSNKDILANYDFKLSNNQKDLSKITIQTYKASKDGLVEENSADYDFGNIENLLLPANGGVKITFKSNVDQEETVFTANDSKLKRDEKTDESKDTTSEVDSLKATIDANDKKIKEEIQNVDKNSVASSKENDLSQLSKDIDYRNKAILSEMKAIDSKQASPEESSGDQLKTVVLNENSSDSKNDKDEVDVDDLKEDIDNRNIEIQKAMQEVDQQYLLYMNQTQNTNKIAANTDQDVDNLIIELDNRNQAIQEELEKIYGKYAVNSIMDLNKSIDDETYELLTGVDKNNEKIDEIIDQVKLSIEANKVLDNKEELENIKVLLDDVDNLSANNEKALETIDKKEENPTISQSFKNVVPGYSENVYKDLEKVVTVTLDPLNDTQNSEKKVSKEQAQKKYPTIAKYLKDLKLVRDLLK